MEQELNRYRIIKTSSEGHISEKKPTQNGNSGLDLSTLLRSPGYRSVIDTLVRTYSEKYGVSVNIPDPNDIQNEEEYGARLGEAIHAIQEVSPEVKAYLGHMKTPEEETLYPSCRLEQAGEHQSLT